MSGEPNGRPFARLEWEGRGDARFDAADLELVLERSGPSLPSEPHAPAGRLILGDNLSVMAGLLSELEGRVDLIYVDPPFLSGKAYSARVGSEEDSRAPEGWSTTHGYSDTWPDGAAYLSMLFPRLQLMHRLLAPTGSLYVHLDWHASAYARVVLDEIFGPERFLNEIVWVYHGPSPIRSAFKRKHDTILVYTKSAKYTFNADAVRVPYDPSTVKTFASSERAGFGKEPDLDRGKVPEDWWYFPVVARLHRERTGYPTQKPEAMLERIILASSNPGDLVADFFCGSGTTPVVAARNGRRWLACDAAPLAIQTTYRRLLLEEAPAAVELWAARGDYPSPSLAPGVEIGHLLGRDIRLRLAEVGGSQAEAGFPDSIVLWEVDWDGGGGTFRSRSHAVRSWRSGELGLELRHTYASSGNRTIAIRASDGLGDWGEAKIPVRIE